MLREVTFAWLKISPFSVVYNTVNFNNIEKNSANRFINYDFKYKVINSTA